MTSCLDWQCKPFNQLNCDELYDLLKLRIDVFVVEQTCYYPDLDDLDRHPDTLHVFLYQDSKMTAYLRILAPGTSYPEQPSIGRVLTAQYARGSGLGHPLIKQGIDACQVKFPGLEIKISAQEHLINYYGQHGFIVCSEPYLEDGIPHIGMKLPS